MICLRPWTVKVVKCFGDLVFFNVVYYTFVCGS